MHRETHFRPQDTFRLKVRGWRTIYHATGSQKKAIVAILVPDKLDFKLKAVTRDKEGHYIIIMWSTLLQQRQSKEEIHCNPGLSQETRKIPKTKSNSKPKGTRSRTTKKPQSQQKKRNNKDQGCLSGSVG